MRIEANIKDWLLNVGDPSLRYRTLTELLKTPVSDPEVKRAREEIDDSKAVNSILSKMEPGGYWLQQHPKTKEVIGDGVEYGAFATTHFCLAYLAELGLTQKHPKVKSAVERYLKLQKPDGDWWNHYSCLIGYNIRTFCLLGYRKDRRVQKAIKYLLNLERWDGGYLCDMHEGKRKKVRSCIRGSAKVLLAFAELPEYKDHQRVKILVEYFLKRGGLYKSHNLNEVVNKDIDRRTFPIIWRTNAWEILYALGKMGYGRDQRLKNAWERLASQAEKTGEYMLDWTPIQCLWKVGRRGEPNPWVTFYALLAQASK